MALSSKPLADLDGSQVLQSGYNTVDSTISVNGFVVGQVGNSIVLAISTTNVANDTETYTFSETLRGQLYQIQIIYTDGTRTQLLSVTRIS